MASSAELIAHEQHLGAHNYQPLDVVLSRGEGVWVWDVDDKRYLDCLSAYSAVNQGHCHPRIRRAMIDQLDRITITSRAFRNDQLALLYEDLAELTGAHRILPMNSGAEAVESAIKAVRKWGYEERGIADGEAEIIVCANNFHGRTISIVSFSTDPTARKGFGPFTPGFKVVPFGDLAWLGSDAIRHREPAPAYSASTPLQTLPSFEPSRTGPRRCERSNPPRWTTSRPCVASSRSSGSTSSGSGRVRNSKRFGHTWASIFWRSKTS